MIGWFGIWKWWMAGMEHFSFFIVPPPLVHYPHSCFFVISKSRKVSLWEYQSINNVEEVEVIQYSCRSNCEAWLALGHQRRHVGGAVIEENHTNYCLHFFVNFERYANSVVLTDCMENCSSVTFQESKETNNMQKWLFDSFRWLCLKQSSKWYQNLNIDQFTLNVVETTILLYVSSSEIGRP